jgi:hypothetical protein
MSRRLHGLGGNVETEVVPDFLPKLACSGVMVSPVL